MSKPALGLAARTIMKLPHMETYAEDGFIGLGFSNLPDGWLSTAFNEGMRMLSWKGRTPGEDDFICYWGDGGFFIVSKNNNIFVLQAAINKMDISLISKHGTSGSMSIWSTPVMVINSRTPENMKDELLRLDNAALEKISSKSEEKGTT